MSQSVPDGRRRSLASLTKYIPYPGIAHAGGLYALRHYEALGTELSITRIAPDTPLNRDASERAADTEAPRLVTSRGLLRGGRLKPLGDVESAWAGSSVTRDVRRAFARGSAPWDVLRAADGIEFQWSEMMALAPLVRERIPGTPLVGIAHDVITQRWERAAHAARWPVSAAYRVASARSGARERTDFRALDAIIVFSQKDADLVQEMVPGAPAEVVLPGLGPATDEQFTREPSPDEPIVLFTGALGRGDNHDAVEWFLNDIWPQIHAQVPSARFIAAGASPRPALERLVARAPRAELTGYVDSLEPYYASASVFVAPLLTGAGVKFKTIDALLRSVPVVSTPVGAEGIEAAETFVSIAEAPGDFAAAVVAALRHPDADRLAKAATWANEAYGLPAFQRRLSTLYRRLGIGA